jgi:hypothetical protein
MVDVRTLQICLTRCSESLVNAWYQYRALAVQRPGLPQGTSTGTLDQVQRRGRIATCHPIPNPDSEARVRLSEPGSKRSHLLEPACQVGTATFFRTTRAGDRRRWSGTLRSEVRGPGLSMVFVSGEVPALATHQDQGGGTPPGCVPAPGTHSCPRKPSSSAGCVQRFEMTGHGLPRRAPAPSGSQSTRRS